MSQSGIQRLYKHESTEFTSVPNWVVRDPEYSPNAFRLLAYLLSHADGYELTYGQIERQTTLGRYAINQAAKFLIDKGWLEWRQKQGADGRWLAKDWIIKNPMLNKPSPNDTAAESFHYGTANGHKEEQLLEKNTNKEKHSKNEDAFEQFWKAYPRGEGKAQAHKAYLKALKKISHDELMKALEVYKTYNGKHGIIFAHASSWLNGERWEDEYEATYSAEVREKSLDSSRAYLEELRQLEQQAAPPPKCEHGNTLARCPICLAS